MRFPQRHFLHLNLPTAALPALADSAEQVDSDSLVLQVPELIDVFLKSGDVLTQFDVLLLDGVDSGGTALGLSELVPRAGEPQPFGAIQRDTDHAERPPDNGPGPQSLTQ